MANDVYSALREGISFSEPVIERFNSSKWAAVRTESNLGMCMYVPGCDSFGIAEINAFYNRGTDFYEPYENHYTRGMDFEGKTVGVVGHLKEMKRRYGGIAKKMYVFELNPKDEEDLPAEMEEELLPQCDIAVITGSSLVNGTLPHLLELCRNAYTVLTGPSVPQCPALLDFGIDRLAGLCVKDIPGMQEYIKSEADCNPYTWGNPFLITK